MKRFILPFLFLAFLVPGFSQQVVTVSGTVTDSASGQPVANQAIQIVSDSSGGFIYFDIVYTDQNGYYADTIPLNGGPTSGSLFVSTVDCNGFTVGYTLAYGPGNMYLVQNFVICSGSPCQADFTYYQNAQYSIQFQNLSTGTSGPWGWNFGDGTTSSLENPSHTYAQAGFYDVTLTIGDSSSGCWDITTQTVSVLDSNSSCTADFESYPDTTSGLMIHFFDQSLGNINSWYWSFGDGSTSTEQNPVHVYYSQGLYTVCLTVEGNDSLCYDTYCEVISAGDSLGCQAQFTYYPDSSQNTRLIHFIDLSSGNIYTWFWDFGDSTYSDEQNPDHMFPGEGTYYVCLTITASSNYGTICESTWCEEVWIGNGSDCVNYFTFQNTGLSVSFSGHMVNPQPADYYWDFGDGESGVGQNIIHQYPQTGIYFITLTTTTQDTTACTWSSYQSITVGDSTQWNQIYGQVYAGNFPMEYGIVMLFSLDTLGTFVPFIDISVADSSGVYYFPTVPSGNYLIYALPVLPQGYLPTYYGDVMNWEDATVITLGQAANPYNINLILAENYDRGIGGIDGQINATGLKSTMVDKITMLLMNSAGQAISYSGVDDKGSFDFSELDYGTYHLKAEMAGCTSDYITVEITPEHPLAEVVMTFTGNHILGTPDGQQALEAGAVYPNPVSDQAKIVVRMNEAAQVVCSVYSLAGQCIVQHSEYLQAGTAILTVRLPDLEDGFYTLRIRSASGLNLTRKLMKFR